MAATKRTPRVKRSEADSVEDPCAVATITRLIHDLYTPNASDEAIRKKPDGDLINWREMLGVVRAR